LTAGYDHAEASVNVFRWLLPLTCAPTEDSVGQRNPWITRPEQVVTGPARSDVMVGTPVQAYNSWWQARSDGWARLEEASGQLAAAAVSGPPPGGLTETIAGLLDTVSPIEQYWAFPGPQACRRARDLFESASYDRLASLVTRVSRTLITRVLPNGHRVVGHRRPRRGQARRGHI
jgi:hypothetical protein